MLMAGILRGNYASLPRAFLVREHTVSSDTENLGFPISHFSDFMVENIQKKSCQKQQRY